MHRAAAATAVALLLTLAACSSGDDSGTTPSASDLPTVAPSTGSSAPAPAASESAKASAELVLVTDDVLRVTPRLESYFRTRDYAMSADEATTALDDAGLELSEGVEVGGYRYDADTVEFTLCLQGPNGAFASYDTRPMSLLTTGETGGCEL